MASISTARNGTRTIQFVGKDGKRRTIRLGKASKKSAAEVCRRVEYLNAASISGTAPDADTVEWLDSIGQELHRRLAWGHSSNGTLSGEQT